MSASAKRQSSKRTTANSGSSANRVFRISMTAVYNSSTIDENAIADGVFEAMSKVGNGLALLHVDDVKNVKNVKNANEAIAKILSKVSGQTQESMASKTTDDGKMFVAVDETPQPKKDK